MKWKETNFYKELQKLGAELKPMTGRQRIDHLWTYYKEYLWPIAFVAVFVCAMIAGIVNSGKEVQVSGMLVNISIDQRGYDYLSTDYAEELGLQGKQTVSLSYTNFGSLEDPNDSEENYYAAMTVVAQVSGAKLDYLILDDMGMKFYIGQDIYLDLREFFTEEELAQLEDRLIYAQAEGSDDRWAVAVDISELPFVRENVLSEGPIYFSLSGSTKRMDQCRKIWEYILDWK